MMTTMVTMMTVMTVMTVMTMVMIIESHNCNSGSRIKKKTGEPAGVGHGMWDMECRSGSNRH